MIHPKTLLISRHFCSLESYVWRSIYNLKIDTISTYYIPLDRSFLKLWNGIRHVMPSTERRLELKEKTSMAQNAWQASVYANGLMKFSKGLDIVNILSRNISKRDSVTNIISISSILPKCLSFFTRWMILNLWALRFKWQQSAIVYIIFASHLSFCTWFTKTVNTGYFIMFSVITNIYNKKTKGPTLMEFFTVTGKLKKLFLTTRDVRCVLCHQWCTHRTSVVVKKTFSVFLWLWKIPLR